MIDDESLVIKHSTYCCILVDVDVSKGLIIEIRIDSSLGSWIQPLDCKGIPFIYYGCFKIGHVSSQCKMEKMKILLGGMGYLLSITKFGRKPSRRWLPKVFHVLILLILVVGNSHDTSIDVA